MSIPNSLRRFRSPLVVLMVFLICLAMARLQLWRAETRGERFEREQAARTTAPIGLMPTMRDPDHLADRAATAQGRWLSSHTVFLDNKIYRSHPGYHVLTPLRLAGSEAVVLVNRGWIPAPRLRSDVPQVTTPSGDVELGGVTHRYESKIFQLQDNPPQGAIWQHVREEEYRRLSGLDVLPVLLLQTSAASDGLVRDWAAADNPASKHYGYAAMWFVFALMAIGYGVIGWRKR